VVSDTTAPDAPRPSVQTRGMAGGIHSRRRTASRGQRRKKSDGPVWAQSTFHRGLNASRMENMTEGQIRN
jgi:hypothetical protein